MKRLVSIFVSLTILGIIYWRIDLRGLVIAFAESDGLVLFAAIFLVVPITWLTAWRFARLVPADAAIRTSEAVRLVLAASSLNMVLPSKMGDLAKAWFIRDRGHMEGGRAFALVVYEKSLDMLSLLVWCAFGLILYQDKDALFWTMTAGVACGLTVGIVVIGSRDAANTLFELAGRVAPSGIAPKLDRLKDQWSSVHDTFWRNPVRVIEVAATSIGLWFLHLFQIWLFILALGPDVPLVDNLALAPLAILAGLLPLTFAGIGTRDAALIFFFAPFMAAPVGAALGLLCTLRYFLPAVGGLPFLSMYLAQAKRETRAT